MRRAAFIFRRDLRLDDNTGLMAALDASQTVLPCFILNSRQVEAHAYRSEFAFQFMLESLMDLDAQLQKKGSRLYVYWGEPERVAQSLIAGGVDGIFVNRDYTPFSLARDAAIEMACEDAGVPFISHNDALLFEPESVGRLYKVFSAYRRFVTQLPRRTPERNRKTNYAADAAADLGISEIQRRYRPNAHRAFQGGRKAGLKALAQLKKIQSYAESREFPAIDGTSFLSAHHKFGTVSIRETAAAADSVWGEDSVFYSELLWRDFFSHVAWYRPDVFGRAFKPRYDAISWRRDALDFGRWCEGRTGVPLVDAGMRQLNKTGYMHNRVRMVVASFLTKDLRLDWRLGEQYFASRLIDYDPCVNNGNWQWAASTGCDALPYFRIFNPWRQQLRFDVRCDYIKKWCPELDALSAKEIHGLETADNLQALAWPRPMVNHRTAAALTLKLFRNL
ncbi:MAG: deoxyribodipyrimidine photo-lyase [Deltaproteobacteria bacterium]|nr:deoxyribodipyrimidine photo-lyase [Deltaproteobacteria bacterium]